MTYDKSHTEDECDKCLKKVGRDNLINTPFLYLDRNDYIHQDVSLDPRYKDYKQYKICEECAKKNV